MGTDVRRIISNHPAAIKSTDRKGQEQSVCLRRFARRYEFALRDKHRIPLTEQAVRC